MTRWLEDSVRGSVKPVTFESYERLVRVHVAPALGRVKLAKLSPAHLQGLYRSKLDAGLSPRTVQYLHVVLHRALKQALRWNLVPRNVSEAVDPPRAHKEEIRPLLTPTHRPAGSSLRPARTVWRPCTCSLSTQGCVRASCWGSGGRTWTSTPGRSRCAAPSRG